MRADRFIVATAVIAGLALTTESLGYVLHNADWSWQNQPIEEPFDLNIGSFPQGFGGGPSSDIEDRYTSALDRWTLTSGADLIFTYGGIRNTASWNSDAYNIAQYHPGPNGNALAVAQYWMSNGNIKDCDIRFYGSRNGGSTNFSTDPNGPGNSEQDFERTATHELGHCLGLSHSNVYGAIMYPSQSPGTSVAERELHADDRAGAQAIYGVGQQNPPPPDPVDAELVLTGFHLTEVGDGDGRFEPTERVLIRYAVDNLAEVDAEDVEAVTTTADPHVSVLTSLATPTLGPDLLATSSDDLEGTEILIEESCREDRRVDFEVVVDADNAPAEAYAFDIDIECGISLSASADWRAGQPAWAEVQGALPGEEIRFDRKIGTPVRVRCRPRAGTPCNEPDGPGKESFLAIADAQGVARWDFVIPAYTRQNAQMWVSASARRDGGDVILQADPVVRRVKR